MPRASPAHNAVRFILVGTGLLLPTLSLIPLGGLYLWEKGLLIWWAVAALLVVAVVYAFQYAIIAWSSGGRKHTALSPVEAQALPPHWSPSERTAWQHVLAIASSCDPAGLDSPQAILDLGLRIVRSVARDLHVDKPDAEWQFTIPEAFTISERVSRRLREFVNENVPFGDRLTLAQFWSMYRLRGLVGLAEKAYDAWRLVRLANPLTAATNEARDRLTRAMYQWGREHITRRLAETYVEEVGRAAIDLYGGRLETSTVATATSNGVPPALASLPIDVLVVTREPALGDAIVSALQGCEALKNQASGQSVEPSTHGQTEAKAAVPRVTYTFRRFIVSGAGRAFQRRLISEAMIAPIVVMIDDESFARAWLRATLPSLATYFDSHRRSSVAPVVIAVTHSDSNDRYGAEFSSTSSDDIIAKANAGMYAVAVRLGQSDAVTNCESLAAAIQQAVPAAQSIQAARALLAGRKRGRWPQVASQLISAVNNTVRTLIRQRR